MSEPIVVEVRRNGVVEAAHRVHAVAVRSGEVVAAAGDASLTCFMRSSSKPLQALPLVRARDDLPDDELAIACASHHDTPEQVAAVRALLARAEATEDDLELGPQEGRPPELVHNNCSGNHAGMLALCRARGWPTEGYRLPEHPVQQACLAVHAEAAGVEPETFATGADGCGIVTFELTLERMAHAFSRLESLAGGARVAAAMRARPDLVGGPDGADYLLMCGAPGWLLYLPRRSVPGTALERVFEIDRSLMFAQKIGKSFIGNLLKTHHPVSCQHGERLPGRVIELHALADHCLTCLRGGRRGRPARVRRGS